MVLGYGHSWLALWVLPLGFVIGLTSGRSDWFMNSLAPGTTSSPIFSPWC